jgi:hypothetical protein
VTSRAAWLVVAGARVDQLDVIDGQEAMAAVDAADGSSPR